jgi:hypothetical protein
MNIFQKKGNFKNHEPFFEIYKPILESMNIFIKILNIFQKIMNNFWNLWTKNRIHEQIYKTVKK